MSKACQTTAGADLVGVLEEQEERGQLAHWCPDHGGLADYGWEVVLGGTAASPTAFNAARVPS